MPRLFAIRAAVLAVAFSFACPAHGAPDRFHRLVVGTADPALVSALSVAVSSRGLTIVEPTEPLTSAEDVAAAHREIASQEAVAIVWLCDDHGAHALCFCDRGGRMVIRHVSVTPPLAPSDAAALALSVKILLWGMLPAPLAPAPAPVPPPPPPAPVPPGLPPATTEVAVEPIAPEVAVELAVGARLQPVAAQHAGLRLGLRSVFAPSVFDHRLGVGAGLGAGPALAVGASKINDLALSVFARGRQRLLSSWLELDIGSSIHFLSDDVGLVARMTDLSFDTALGFVVPVGRGFIGARAGGLAWLTTASSLPRWGGEVSLTLGFALL